MYFLDRPLSRFARVYMAPFNNRIDDVNIFGYTSDAAVGIVLYFCHNPVDGDWF